MSAAVCPPGDNRQFNVVGVLIAPQRTVHGLCLLLLRFDISSLTLAASGK
jgi:hypothetical protein